MPEAARACFICAAERTRNCAASGSARGTGILTDAAGVARAGDDCVRGGISMGSKSSKKDFLGSSGVASGDGAAPPCRACWTSLARRSRYCLAVEDAYFVSWRMCRSRAPCARKKSRARPLPPRFMASSWPRVHVSMSTLRTNVRCVPRRRWPPAQSRQMKTPNVDDAQMGLRCGQSKHVRLSALASSFRKTRSRSSLGTGTSAMPAVCAVVRTAPADAAR